ncbi:MAG TPA: M56 family metallopeptidase [Chthoniobacteraceae bacterium]|nr:M56 family metallopeptidase [Chthoniobacteraceae bacterium]
MNIPQIPIQGLAITSLLVSASIAIFLPLRPLLRRAIGSRWLCVMWVAILVRLLAPWPVESRWSLFNRWHEQAPAQGAAGALKIRVSFPQGDMARNTEIVAPSVPKVRTGISSAEILTIAWLSGVAAGLAMLVRRWGQNRRLRMGVSDATDERLLNIFESIPMEWRRGVGLKTTDALRIPTLSGVFHPQIWMPRDWPAQFTDEELRNVMLHEIGHADRGDLAVQWLFAFAQCLHWFNPLVWLATRAARLDREMACDAWVLSRAGSSQAGYGATLMKTVQFLRPGTRTAGVLAMASSRRGLRARILGIGEFRAVPAWRGIAAAGIAAVAVVVITTGRTAAQEQQPQPSRTTTTQVMLTPAEAPKAAGPLVAVKMDFFEISDADAKKLGLIDLLGGMDAKQIGYKETSGDEAAITGAKSSPGGGLLDPASVEALLAKLNKATSMKLLSAPSVTTRTGQRAVVEVVREFRYPTEFDTNKKTGKPMPTAFETRNTGVTLEVEPKMAQNGRIQLDMAPQIVTFLGFMTYGEDNNGKFIKAPPGMDEFASQEPMPMKPVYPGGNSVLQPFFSTRKMTVSTTVSSGQSVIFGGLRSVTAKGKLIFFLTTATIVSDQGN